MTHTARALLTGSLVVLLALCATAFAAVPDEPRPDVAKPSEPPRLAGPDGNTAMWPALAEMLQPIVLAAVCAGALAFFSARPKASVRVRARRRK